jgi:hypothetical protein
MLKTKSLIIAAAVATLGTAALSTQAHANDELLGAVVGAGIGAAIGHGVQGHNGAIVGGAIGAVAGAAVAANSQPYYNGAYYSPPVYASPAPVYAPAPVYYGDAPTYYQAAPVYYSRPAVVYGPRVNYVRYYGPRYVDHRSYDHGRQGWQGDNGHH